MKINIALLATAAMLACALPGPLAAQTTAEKQLRAIAAQPLQLKVSATRKAYAVGEAISLQLDLGKPAFIYVYTRDNSGKSSLFEIGGAVSAQPQPAGKAMLRNIFTGDVAGEEEIVVFAAADRLKLPATEKLQNITTRIFEAQLADLGVSVGSQVRAPAKTGFSEPVSLVLKIGASADSAVTGAGFAILNTDKRTYKVGETVQLAVGSTAKGFVQLFTRDPGKAPAALKTESFTAAGLKMIAAEAALPTGEQYVLAVWSADGKVTVAQLEAAGFSADIDSSAMADKALSLRDAPVTAATPSLNVIVHSFTVEG